MTNDKLAATAAWLGAYRGKSLDVVDMYEQNATLYCACSAISLTGISALEKYWTERFVEQPAIELIDLQLMDGGAVFVSYRTPTALVKAVLGFDISSGKIAWQRCGPDAIIRRLNAGVP